MEITIVSALSGVLGSLVGGSATIATAWISQRTLGKRELVQAEMRKREALYGEFIAECSKLLIDALTNTLEEPETLQPAYALLNRIRLTASDAVLEQAERLLERITDQYFARNLSVQQLREIALTPDGDPLTRFGQACRAELKSIRAGV